MQECGLMMINVCTLNIDFFFDARGLTFDPILARGAVVVLCAEKA